MLLKKAQPPVQRFHWRQPVSATQDPASLSASLRELAVRAHHLVRQLDDVRSQERVDSDGGVLFNLQQELIELRSEIVQLQRGLRAENLSSLAAYVSALRQKIDEYLA
jgi:hypothetical protein